MRYCLFAKNDNCAGKQLEELKNNGYEIDISIPQIVISLESDLVDFCNEHEFQKNIIYMNDLIKIGYKLYSGKCLYTKIDTPKNSESELKELISDKPIIVKVQPQHEKRRATK
jgi:hypothetical protein